MKALLFIVSLILVIMVPVLALWGFHLATVWNDMALGVGTGLAAAFVVLGLACYLFDKIDAL